jgi:hypothetical protein
MREPARPSLLTSLRLKLSGVELFAEIVVCVAADWFCEQLLEKGRQASNNPRK